jgi:hypothetical protein
VGKGYWLKFNSPQTTSIQGQTLSQLQIPVRQGWNLIGTLNSSIPVNSVTSNPSNIIASPFYEYAGSYSSANLLQSGKGYWVKCSQNGSLFLSPTNKSNSVFNLTKDFEYELSFSLGEKSAKLYVTNSSIDYDFYELPPIPPSGSFDVRFISNSFVESWSSNELIIKVQTEIFPIKLTFNSKNFNEAISVNLISNGQELEFVLWNGESISLDGKTEVIKIKKVTAPKNFVLYQNYPNPFNPVTTIHFYIPEISRVELNVYDITGRIVETLINQNLSPGFHKVQFDGSRFSSGMYFYELKSNKFKSIKKMLLIK